MLAAGQARAGSYDPQSCSSAEHGSRHEDNSSPRAGTSQHQMQRSLPAEILLHGGSIPTAVRSGCVKPEHAPRRYSSDEAAAAASDLTIEPLDEEDTSPFPTAVMETLPGRAVGDSGVPGQDVLTASPFQAPEHPADAPEALITASIPGDTLNSGLVQHGEHDSSRANLLHLLMDSSRSASFSSNIVPSERHENCPLQTVLQHTCESTCGYPPEGTCGAPSDARCKEDTVLAEDTDARVEGASTGEEQRGQMVGSEQVRSLDAPPLGPPERGRWAGRMGAALALAGGSAAVISGGLAGGAAVAAAAATVSAVGAAGSAAGASAAAVAAAGSATVAAAGVGATAGLGAWRGGASGVDGDGTARQSGTSGEEEAGVRAGDYLSEGTLRLTLADVQPRWSRGAGGAHTRDRHSVAESDMHTSDMTSISSMHTSDAGSMGAGYVDSTCGGAAEGACGQGGPKLGGVDGGVSPGRSRRSVSEPCVPGEARCRAWGEEGGAALLDQQLQTNGDIGSARLRRGCSDAHGGDAGGGAGEQLQRRSMGACLDRCAHSGEVTDFPGSSMGQWEPGDGSEAGNFAAAGTASQREPPAPQVRASEEQSTYSTEWGTAAGQGSGGMTRRGDGTAGDAAARDDAVEVPGGRIAGAGEGEVGGEAVERMSMDFTESENPYLEFLRAAVGQHTLDEAVAASGDYADEATESMRRRMHEEVLAREAAALREEVAAAERQEEEAWARLRRPAVPLHARPPLPSRLPAGTLRRERKQTRGEGPSLEGAALWLDPVPLLDRSDCSAISSTGGLPHSPTVPLQGTSSQCTGFRCHALSCISTCTPALK